MDSFGEIGVFVRVVDRRSFTRAAQSMGLTASGVSRAVSRLEARLGVRLLERTTRSLGLTADGAAYYEQCSRILRELADADDAIARSRGAPRGRLRVDTATVIGQTILGPLVPRLLDRYPELSLDLTIRDHVIDPVAEGVDVVLRMAELRESDLVHRKLGTLRLLVVGSPAYFARHGRPTTPAELRKHQLLGFLAGPMLLPWKLRHQGRDVTVLPAGRLNTNSFEALRASTLGGHGLAQMFELHARDGLASGALQSVLADYERPRLTLHALYTREKAALPKVRVFLDFMAEHMQRLVRRA